MARIDISRMKKEHKTSTRLHELVKATYDVFILGGEKIFQIDTYGRPDRMYTEKISQTIQLDEKNAKELLKLLKAHFE